MCTVLLANAKSCETQYLTCEDLSLTVSVYIGDGTLCEMIAIGTELCLRVRRCFYIFLDTWRIRLRVLGFHEGAPFLLHV